MLQHRPRTANGVPKSALPPATRIATAGILSIFFRLLRVTRWVGGVITPLIIGLGIAAAAEMWAPADWKPSSIIGSVSGNEKMTSTAIEITALKSAAAAQADGAIHAQQVVQEFRAKTERLTQACQALYKRVDVLNSIVANTQQDYVKGRQELLVNSLSGRLALANMTDVSPLYGQLFGAMTGGGKPENPKITRQKILDEYDRAMQEGLEKAISNLRQWTPGLGKFAVSIDTMVPSDCIPPPSAEPAVVPPPIPSRYEQKSSAKH